MKFEDLLAADRQLINMSLSTFMQRHLPTNTLRNKLLYIKNLTIETQQGIQANPAILLLRFKRLL